MKRSKKTTGKQAPTPDEFADAIVRKLDLNMSPYSMRRHLMHFGLPEEKAAQLAEGARRALLELRKVDYDARLVFILSHLDRLLEKHQREGNAKAALEVIREQNKLLRLNDYVQPLPEHERLKRPRTDYEDAMSELSSVQREQLRKEITQRVSELTGRLTDFSKPAVTESPMMRAEPGPATSD